MELAKSLNISCTVIQFKLDNWSDQKTELLKLKYNEVEFIEISATRKPIINWLMSTCLELFFSAINSKLLNNKLLAFSINKRSYLILLETLKLKTEFDWVIAHNPGSFYPAFNFSKRTGSKLGFDIEDYHPGETNNVEKSQRVLKMMKSLLLKANYCSFASPLIQQEVENQFDNGSKNWFPIINGFPKDEFIIPKETESQKLRIVWFSQNITPDRGLDSFIQVVNKLYDQVELHLIGNLSIENEKKLLLNKKGIFIYEPFTQKELHLFISQFDVGLAIEPGKDLNNTIALSNKLLAYVQAGLYVVATPTLGQLEFLNNSNLNFTIVQKDETEILKCLKKLIIIKQIEGLNKQEQFLNAQRYTWEKINLPLIKAWNS